MAFQRLGQLAQQQQPLGIELATCRGLRFRVKPRQRVLVVGGTEESGTGAQTAQILFALGQHGGRGGGIVEPRQFTGHRHAQASIFAGSGQRAIHRRPRRAVIAPLAQPLRLEQPRARRIGKPLDQAIDHAIGQCIAAQPFRQAREREPRRQLIRQRIVVQQLLDDLRHPIRGHRTRQDL